MFKYFYNFLNHKYLVLKFIREERSGIRKECHLFFVPRRSQPCETRLQVLII